MSFHNSIVQRSFGQPAVRPDVRPFQAVAYDGLGRPSHIAQKLGRLATGKPAFLVVSFPPRFAPRNLFGAGADARAPTSWTCGRPSCATAPAFGPTSSAIAWRPSSTLSWAIEWSSSWPFVWLPFPWLLGSSTLCVCETLPLGRSSRGSRNDLLGQDSRSYIVAAESIRPAGDHCGGLYATRRRPNRAH